jgi:hemoglobin-like flavoprotein
MISRRHAASLEETLPHQRSHDTPPLCLTPAPFGLPTPIAQPPRRPSPRDIAAIQASLAAVRRRPVTLAETFYAHLFEMQPAARTMFADDMTAQMQRMTDTLLATLAALQHDDTAPTTTDDNLAEPALERSLHKLGALHRDRWSDLPEHYLYIAHALTRAVRDVAGPAWSGSLSSSWIALTQWITGHMLDGHHRGSPRH